MKRYDRPNSACRSMSRLMTCACTDTSSAETGSSQTITFGSTASARAIPSRWRCPPENSCGYLRIWSGRRPTRANSRATRSVRFVARCDAVVVKRLADDLARVHARIERRIRILEDHLQAAPARAHRGAIESRDVLAFQRDRAARGLDQAQDRLSGRRLPAAALADEAQRFARGEVERHAVHGLHRADLAPEEPAAHRVVLDQRVDFEHGLAPARSRAQRTRPSPATRRRSSRRRNGPAPLRPPAEMRRGIARSHTGSAARTCSLPPCRSATARRRESPSGDAARTDSSGARLSRGIDVINPRVYGWRGRANSAFTDASSTLRPAYITTTRCAVSAITPRSCVISMTAAPVRSFISSIRSRICAWMVTSSAVVGSSAIRMRRRARHRDRDHHALPHAARELMRILAGTPPRLRDLHEREHLDRPVQRRARAADAGAARRFRRSGGPPS